ncbi:hypothetical protein F2Q69_00036874 [Brassica cretica]|uniref:Uncharacterized protein n=1 Tax=Brassica cretica TaxID=69181 RepID=A0A8S9SH87_BRACR|nr:hypothetical protein F2Q69_00036874 [Brassica cretica]
MQVVQTEDTVKRQEALAREAGVEKAKHHVNAIIDDDFWQVVKHEKIGEGDFEVESSMSFGGSLWCRPMSMDAHRSTDHDEDRLTDYSNHRSTSSAESTAECSAVRIMTHEKFAEQHPHPPSPFYVKIDRRHEPGVDRQRETDINRPPSPPIDRWVPLTYRVRLPSIDSDRINALRPSPKPLANPPEPTTNPSDTTPEPMKVDEATEGRRLRKRKEKIPKNLKREANKKEMDGFPKRFLRILVEKPFDEVYYTHQLWMFFRETKETEEDIRRMFHHVRKMMKPRITLKKKSDPGKFAILCVVKGSWADSGFYESFAVETVIPSSNENPTEEYDEDYWKERAIEIAMHDVRYSSHSFNNMSPPSIDRVYSASVDTHPHPAKRSYASIDTTPVEKPFDEVYYTHRLWMFFRETKETEEDIRRMFHHVRERMKLRITLKKKSDPGKFAIPCVVKGIEFPHALCDTGASVNLVELGNDFGYIAACHCGAEYETEYSESINTHTASSIDSNESPTTDEHYPTSLDGNQPVDHFTLPDQCYIEFAFHYPTKEDVMTIQ